MPDFELEDETEGLVAGVDEAGRGPWVGPVVAGCAVFLNRNVDERLLSELNDSKKLSKKKREMLYALLESEAQKGNVLIGIGEASAKEIDEINILNASFLAMKRAIAKAGAKPDLVLIDGNRLPKDFGFSAKAVIKGDAKSYSISAASILAKVYRDRLMEKMALVYPEYGFEKNAGYGTKAHIEGLKKFGVTPEHRRTYAPIKEFLK
ncbi:MAG: ribonuclease HII [Alphaproteobacteria bacterium]|nr:ribonuclease HII [Alphaproteobacteria bacterium]